MISIRLCVLSRSVRDEMKTKYNLNETKWNEMYSLGPGGLELLATHERDITQALGLHPYGTTDVSIQFTSCRSIPD